MKLKENQNKEQKEFAFILITEPGCEKFCEEEIKQRFKINKENIETFEEKEAVLIKTTKEKIIEIAYSSQTSKRALALTLITEFDGTLEGLESQLRANLKKEELEKIICNQKFRVNCERTGDHPFNSVNAEQITGIEIEKILENNNLVDLKTPEIKIHLMIKDNSAILGLDIAGKDLSKREYRVFNNPNNIKGTIAFSLLTFSGYKPGMNMIDPFALSGTIPIEAAIYESGISLNYYNKNPEIKKTKFINQAVSESRISQIMEEADKQAKKSGPNPRIKAFDALFTNVSAQKKNAKVAGVEKYISFSRTEAEWIDIKLDEKSVDIIASRLIEPSKHIPEKRAQKIYSEFFSRIHYCLKKTAILAFILRDPSLAIKESEKLGYKTEETKKISQGLQEMHFVKMTYKNNK